MTNIHIGRNDARPVAPDLYGLFFEDINRAGDSGLYPEMLRNRAFEDSIIPKECTEPEDGAYFVTKNGYREPFNHGEGVSAWANRVEYTPIPAWYSENAEMELDLEDTLNKNREAALKVRFNAGGSIKNIGCSGVPAAKGTAVLFYAFWKADHETELTVSIVGHDGKVLASGKAIAPAGDYARADIRLVPADDDPQSSLVISSPAAAQVKLGFTSLMPEDTYLGHGLRTDLVELLKKTRSKFMRYPGGCVVEGLNKDTAMRFTDTVGPVWERVSKWNLWHYRSTNGFGFHEYLQLCEDLGMEALYVVNCGMSCQAREPEFFDENDTADMLSQAFMAMEYAMGGTDTKWGALRAQMGHPAPFKIKYIEIGNENDGPEYDKRYIVFYEKLHEAYPDVILISNAHTETRGLPTQYVDEHYYSDWQFFAQSGRLYDHYPKDGVKIFLGEYAVTRGEDVGTLHSALSETSFMMGVENYPEVVKLASYAPLFENIGYKSWNPNLISFDNHRSCGIPFLHALGMLGASRGSRVLPIERETEMLQPEKYGFAGIVAYENGVRIKTPTVNGEECPVRKEVIGHWVPKDGELVSDASGNENLDSITRYPLQLTISNGVFTTRKANKLDYTARVFVDKTTPKFALTVWAHNTTEPGIMDLYPDKNAPEGSVQPKELWGLFDTEYYTWTIENGRGRACYLYRYQEHPLAAERELPIKYGEFNEFTVKTDSTGYDCYLNGEHIFRVEDRKYGRIEAVATEDDEYLYIKLLNNSDKAETAHIDCGAAIEGEYSWEMISGEPKDRNDLDEPEKICAVSGKASLEGAELIWNAPAWSFAVLKLKKA